MYIIEELSKIQMYLEWHLCYKYKNRNKCQSIKGSDFNDEDIIIVIYDDYTTDMLHIKMEINRIGQYVKVKGYKYYLTPTDLVKINETLSEADEE